MAKVATDDTARRLEFVWLGEPAMPWPFEARATAWMWAAIVLPALWVITYLLIPALLIEGLTGLPGPIVTLLKLLLSLAIGTALGVGAIRAVGRRISPTTPVRHHTAVLMHEVTSPRPDGPPLTHRIAPSATELFLETRSEGRVSYVVTTPAFLNLEETDDA